MPGKRIVINFAADVGEEIGFLHAAVPGGKDGNLTPAVEHSVTGSTPAHTLTKQLFFAWQQLGARGTGSNYNSARHDDVVLNQRHVLFASLLYETRDASDDVCAQRLGLLTEDREHLFTANHGHAGVVGNFLCLIEP